ncbi:MAG: hypothetical protein NC398_06965 [Acetatifactor muris]|nr:hypothetical protein [Acetatifactor muris]MCM1525677.1 hypothetical protein [Bacteroides sp.]
MDDMGRQSHNFVGYEYKEIVAESDRVSLLLDGYESFGWEPDENIPGSGSVIHAQARKKAALHLKRNRKIINKAELTRLQRNFEACVGEIDALERAKTSKATVYALVMAVIGTAFMAGSVFAITAPTPYIILSTLLGVPGVIGWILPYFLYRKTVNRQTQKLTPLIEAKYDEIYEICEKGNKLLH